MWFFLWQATEAVRLLVTALLMFSVATCAAVVAGAPLWLSIPLGVIALFTLAVLISELVDVRADLRDERARRRALPPRPVPACPICGTPFHRYRPGTWKWLVASRAACGHGPELDAMRRRNRW